MFPYVYRNHQLNLNYQELQDQFENGRSHEVKIGHDNEVVDSDKSGTSNYQEVASTTMGTEFVFVSVGHLSFSTSSDFAESYGNRFFDRKKYFEPWKSPTEIQVLSICRCVIYFVYFQLLKQIDKLKGSRIDKLMKRIITN